MVIRQLEKILPGLWHVRAMAVLVISLTWQLITPKLKMLAPMLFVRLYNFWQPMVNRTQDYQTACI